MNGELQVTPVQSRVLDAMLEIDEISPLASGSVGYAARLWAQLSLPYKNPGDVPYWARRNGALELVVRPARVRDFRTGEPYEGYPYGVLPRYLLTWISTEAVRTQSPQLELGPSLSAFLRQLHLGARGGVRGDLTRLNDQTQRLFGAMISVTDSRVTDSQMRTQGQNLLIADSYDLWSTSNPNGSPLGASYVKLSQQFFNSIMDSPVPVDLRALGALRGSPLRIDIYTWLVHRLPYLRRKTTLPWELLTAQFGSDYKQLHRFRAAFEKQLAPVLAVYPAAADCVEATSAGLVISRASTAVPRRPRQLPR